MTLLCHIFGHRWRTFNAEQCRIPYSICIRCDRVRHACNEIDWSAPPAEPPANLPLGMASSQQWQAIRRREPWREM